MKFECYFGSIPEKFRLHLIDLYQTPYCTIEYNQSFCPNFSPNCFAIFEEDALRHLIVFIHNKQFKQIIILNRVVNLEAKYLSVFSNYIFKRLEINSIHIEHQLSSISEKFSKAYICTPKGEDYVIPLPASKTEYISMLSPNMRRHTKNYISKIKRTFGDFHFKVIETQEISKKIIDRIVEMNHQRMANKNIISGIDRPYAEKIMQFTHHFGHVSILEIKGKIVAGLISYAINGNYFVEELSSDPQFDKYNVGHTCLFLTIQDCINRKGKKFHLLWGNNPYKKRFLGERVQLYSCSIFRKYDLKYLHLWKNSILPKTSIHYIFKTIKRKIKSLLGIKIVNWIQYNLK